MNATVTWQVGLPTYLDDVGSLLFIPESSIVPTAPGFAADGSLDYGYAITGASLDQATTVDLYWATGMTTDTEMGNPIATTMTQTAVGTYNIAVTSDQLGERPTGATDLLVVADPDNLISPSDPGKIAYLPLPSIEPTDLSFDSTDADGGVDFSYSIDADLSQTTTVALYWADGDTTDDTIGSPITSATTGTTPGTFGPFNVHQSEFDNPPPGATNLLLVIDPNHVVPDSDGSANVLSLSLDPDIDLSGLSVTDGDTDFTYDYATTDDLVPFTVSFYFSPTQQFDPSTAVPVLDPATGQIVTQTIDPTTADEPDPDSTKNLLAAPADIQSLPDIAAVAIPSDQIPLLNTLTNVTTAPFTPVAAGALRIFYPDHGDPSMDGDSVVYTGTFDIGVAQSPLVEFPPPLLEVSGGLATISDGTADISGTVSEAINTDNLPLFEGEWTIPMSATGTTLPQADSLVASAPSLAGNRPSSVSLTPDAISLTANFGIPNFLGGSLAGAGELAITAQAESLTIQNLPLPAGFALSNTTIESTISSAGDSYSGQTTLKMPGSLALMASLGFSPAGALDGIDVSFTKGQGSLSLLSFSPTLISLTELSGSLTFSDQVPSFTGSVGISVGPTLDFDASDWANVSPGLPSWANSIKELASFHGSLLSLSGDVTLTSQSLSVENAQISGLISATGDFSINWAQATLSLDVGASAFLGTLEAGLSLKVTTASIDAEASVTFRPLAIAKKLLPNWLTTFVPDPKIGATVVVKYALQGDQFIQITAWGSVAIDGSERTAELGIFVPLNGDAPRPIDDVEDASGQILDWSQPPTTSTDEPLAAVPAEPSAALGPNGSLSQSYQIRPVQRHWHSLPSGPTSPPRRIYRSSRRTDGPIRSQTFRTAPGVCKPRSRGSPVLPAS